MDEQHDRAPAWDERFVAFVAQLPEVGPPETPAVSIGGGGPDGHPIVVQASRTRILLFDGDAPWVITRR